MTQTRLNTYVNEMNLEIVKDVPERKFVVARDNQGRTGTVPYAWLKKEFRPSYQREQARRAEGTQTISSANGYRWVISEAEEDQYDWGIRNAASGYVFEGYGSRKNAVAAKAGSYAPANYELVAKYRNAPKDAWFRVSEKWPMPFKDQVERHRKAVTTQYEYAYRRVSPDGHRISMYRPPTLEIAREKQKEQHRTDKWELVIRPVGSNLDSDWKLVDAPEYEYAFRQTRDGNSPGMISYFRPPTIEIARQNQGPGKYHTSKWDLVRRPKGSESLVAWEPVGAPPEVFEWGAKSLHSAMVARYPTRESAERGIKGAAVPAQWVLVYRTLGSNEQRAWKRPLD